MMEKYRTQKGQRSRSQLGSVFDIIVSALACKPVTPLFRWVIQSIRTRARESFKISSRSSEFGLVAIQKQCSKGRLLAPKIKAAAVAKRCLLDMIDLYVKRITGKTSKLDILKHSDFWHQKRLLLLQ